MLQLWSFPLKLCWCCLPAEWGRGETSYLNHLLPSGTQHARPSRSFLEQERKDRNSPSSPSCLPSCQLVPTGPPLQTLSFRLAARNIPRRTAPGTHHGSSSIAAHDDNVVIKNLRASSASVVAHLAAFEGAEGSPTLSYKVRGPDCA